MENEGSAEQPSRNPEPAEDSTVESSPAAEAKGRRIGEYRILRKLGEGGMGVVYEAGSSIPGAASP